MTKTSKKRMIRPQKGRRIAGVCQGLAEYTGIDVAIIRVIFLVLLLPGGLPGLIPYVLFWIAIPSEA